MKIKRKDRKPLLRWKVGIKITHTSRSKTGFVVRGPDGKLAIEPSRKGAVSNLKARMACHTVQPWTIAPATPEDLEEMKTRQTVWAIDNDIGD